MNNCYIGKSYINEGKDAASAENNACKEKTVGVNLLVSLASLAQALSSQAKGLSNSLLSNIAAQLAATQGKGAEIAWFQIVTPLSAQNQMRA